MQSTGGVNIMNPKNYWPRSKFFGIEKVFDQIDS